jgi:hypothetical protein
MVAVANVRTLSVRRWCVIVAMVAGVLSTAMFVRRVEASPPASETKGQAIAVFTPPRTKAEALIDGMDGEAYAQIASDPLITHPADDFLGDRFSAAYRFSRPAFGWVDWVASLGGDRDRLATGVVVASLLSIAGLALLTARFAARTGRHPLAGAAVLGVVGVGITALDPGGCEPFGCAFTLLGLHWWLDGRRGRAVAAFTVAALTRETLLIVPLAIALSTLVTRRTLRGMAPLAIPAVAYGAWSTVVRIRVGVWPAAYPNHLATPWHGLVPAMRYWGSLEWVAVVSSALLLTLAWLRLRDPVFRTIIVVHVLFAAVMSEEVWAAWTGFSRVWIPAAILGVVAAAPRWRAATDTQLEAGASTSSSGRTLSANSCRLSHAMAGSMPPTSGRNLR